MDYKEKKERKTKIIKKINYNYKASKDPEFKNINLFKEQRIIIQAMMDIENSKNFSLNYGRLSERYGFGKTIILLALIKLNQVNTFYSINKKHKVGDFEFNVKKVFRNNNMLKPSIVFSNKDNADNWYKTIKKYTSLKSLYIRGIVQMRKLNTLIQNNKINDYDVIIVKNGTTNSSVNIEGYVENEEKKQKHLINIIASITKYKCWTRSIFDLDISLFKTYIYSINALFTWFVEVKNDCVNKKSNDERNYTNIYDILTYNNVFNGYNYNICNIKFDKCINKKIKI